MTARPQPLGILASAAFYPRNISEPTDAVSAPSSLYQASDWRDRANSLREKMKKQTHVQRINAKPVTAKRMLRIATKLIAQGFSILPLKSPTAGDLNSGKKPITKHGVKDATNNLAVFKKLVKGRQSFNIGIATGDASAVFGIDVDTRNKGDETFAALQRNLGNLPKTVTVKTGGGGLHLYFRLPKKGLRSTKLGAGVDLQAEGKYLVAPPSRHGSGKIYVFAKGLSPSKIAIAKIPKAWLDYIRGCLKKAPGQNLPVTDQAITEGGRNSQLTKAAGSLRASGLSETEISDALKAVNRNRCHPPLPESEVEGIARSVAKYPLREQIESTDAGEQLAQATLDVHFESGANLRYEKDGRFWRWLGTNWEAFDDKHLQRLILETAGNLPKKGRTRSLILEAFSLLQIRQSGSGDLLHIQDEPPQVINVSNGEIWLNSDGSFEVKPHDRKSGMTHVLPVKFDASASCPQYDAAIKQIFRDAQNPETLIDFVNELIAYAIQPRRHYAMIVVFYGAGSNGKTSLVELIRRLIGPGLVYSGRVDQLEGHRFALGHLFGKLLYLDDDMKSGIKLPDGVLKKISEAKTLTGEHKNRPLFDFTNTALPILLCNNVPSLADLSHGMMRRLKVVPFSRIFREKEIDRRLFERIAATELSGVLNRALEGWKRLQSQGHFTKSVDVLAANKLFLAHANPLQGFIDECCKKDSDGKIEMHEFYDRYKDWAADNGFTLTQTQPTVRKNLEHLGFYVPRHGVGRVIKGLSFKGPKFD